MSDIWDIIADSVSEHESTARLESGHLLKRISDLESRLTEVTDRALVGAEQDAAEIAALRARLALAERLADAASDLANVSKPSATADKVVGLVAEWDRGRGGEK